MSLRIFYILLAVGIAYVSYNIISTQMNYRGLGSVPAEFTIGPADADLTVVEFLDYSCPYCREVHPTITEAIKRDGKIRYVPRPLPSQDKNSYSAAMLSLMAGTQRQFPAVHNELMSNYRVLNLEIQNEILQRAGIDAANFGNEEQMRAAQDYLMKNGRAFQKLDRHVTPSFIIGKSIFYVPEGRMPTVEDFLKMFAEARAAD
jgi:protein-disulfide isomerase